MPEVVVTGSSDDSARHREGAYGSGSVVTFPRAREPSRLTDNLPVELSSFVGREREISEVKGSLATTRLLTLAGPGGCGKTRLALAVAFEVVEGLQEGGAWWVELAPLSDPDLVPQAVAAALKVREVPGLPLTETLAEHLGSKKVLLVLDNCEHLVDACAALADALLRACPDLRILATSREALGIGGESAWPVPSLSLPDPGRLPPVEELGRYEAVRLFVERAKAVASDFELTEENAPAVVRVCHRLDGMPLAIELAAARVRVLTPEHIATRLEDSFGLLKGGSRTAPPRQQTLRAVIDWSYELLGEEERVLFRRLSVFAGGFTLLAAEGACAGEGIEAGEVLDLLSLLADKSLVVVGEHQQGEAEARYRLLETVRQYGHEKLDESGEAGRVRERHAEHYLAFAEAAEPELLGADQGRWLRRLRTEFGNLRGALSWSLEPGREGESIQEVRLRLAAALWRSWGVEGFEEGKHWLRTALERDPGGFPAVRAKALDGLGFILLFQQDYGPAIAAAEEAIALHKELGDGSGAALALANLGYAALHGGYRERVADFLREGEALMSEDLEDHARAYLRMVLAAAALLEEGDLDSVVAQLEESLALFRELGDVRLVAMSLLLLGLIELNRDDLERGATLLEEGARIPWELKDRLCGVYYVLALGKVNALRRKPARAARLWGAAEGLRERMGMSLSHFDVTNSGYEQVLAYVRSALDEAAWEAAWAEGRGMTPEQAIEYALETEEEPSALPTTTTTPPLLPGRTPAGSKEEPAQPPPAEAEEAPPQPLLRISTLGASRVEKGGRALTSADWTYAKPKELFFYLLSHPGGRTKEQIGLALWPEASVAQLRSTFHVTLHRLRRTLGRPEWVIFEERSYSFNRSLSYFLDAEAFEEKLTEAKRLEAEEEPGRAITLLEEGLGLYRGDFLEDVAVEGEWATVRREDLGRKYVDGLVELGGLLMGQGRQGEAVGAYRRAIAQDGYLEEAHRGLMGALWALGERGQALKHYEGLVELLGEEMGCEPAPETKELFERLRSGQDA